MSKTRFPYESLYRDVRIMGILNVTPDSFSDGGSFRSVDQALAHAESMIRDGADIIDVGGESTRPGAQPMPLQEELDRTIPVIEKLSGQNVLISIDTYKSAVAQAAIKAGAHLINDISGGAFDPEIFTIAARQDVPLVIMHIRGTPKNMQIDPTYQDVVAEVYVWLETQCEKAQAAGVDQLIVDPGFGFGKRYEDNFTLLKNLDTFIRLGFPVMAGTSRKSFLGKAFDAPPADRLEGTIVSNIVAVQKGATLLRVHDVRAIKRALTIWQTIQG